MEHTAIESVVKAILDNIYIPKPGGSLYGVQYTNQGKIVIFGGGVPLMYKDRVIGGLGVSGGSEEQDTYLADYGIRCLKEVLNCH